MNATLELLHSHRSDRAFTSAAISDADLAAIVEAGWRAPTAINTQQVSLVVVRDDGHVLPIEVKLSSTVGDSDTRHLRWLAERLGDKVIDKIILNTGPEAYRRRDGVAVIPLSLLGP